MKGKHRAKGITIAEGSVLCFYRSTIYHSTILTVTSFIQLDFVFIIYMIYNKFITFLSYFEIDRKYPNSIRIVVDRGPSMEPCI